MTAKTTLGDVLSAPEKPPRESWAGRLLPVLPATCLAVLPLGVSLGVIGAERAAIWALVCLVVLGFLSQWAAMGRRGAATHFLIKGDRQGIMTGLRLDRKTAVIDGSNIYHFGAQQGAGPTVLRLLVQRLRHEGFRVVCFFDANIFFTMQEAGDLAKGARHQLAVLTQLFGLSGEEVYVVPSGVQADTYVLSTIEHLPTSFAVTNDRFRDHAKAYGHVMAEAGWRKGVVIRDGEVQLTQYKFNSPIRVAH